MTKIFITVDSDAKTKAGRNIRVKVITDDELVNVELKAPFIWSKTFTNNESVSDIRKIMKRDIKGLIKNTSKALLNNGLVGKEFEVEV